MKAGTENPKLKEEAYSLRVTRRRADYGGGHQGVLLRMKTLEQPCAAAGRRPSPPDIRLAGFEIRGFMNDVAAITGRSLIAQELDSMAHLKRTCTTSISRSIPAGGWSPRFIRN
ncbi:MAG: hypothetical protein ACLT8E_11825 [Akkermansia sp.]